MKPETEMLRAFGFVLLTKFGGLFSSRTLLLPLSSPQRPKEEQKLGNIFFLFITVILSEYLAGGGRGV